MFKLEIKTSGAAFCNNDGEEDKRCEILEVSRILREIQYNLTLYEQTSGSCIDICGNKVGTWKLN